MLGFLPAPVADELLYSVIARYGAMIGQRVGSQLILDFFGTPVGVTAVDLPNRIDSLVQRLPPGTPFDRDRIIDRHTLFPYQLRFASPSIAAAVRDYMAGDASRRPARIGVMSASFPAGERMMLCTACAREDASASGIAAWRRVHQLPGVLVCPRHGTALAESAVKRLDRRGRGALVPLTPDVRRSARPLRLPRGSGDSLQRFALGAERLLGREPGTCDLAALQARLRTLLADYRWSRAPSLIHTAALAADFEARPAIRHLMTAIDIAWTRGRTVTAMNRMLYRDEMPKHPLMVLMTLELAGASLDDLDGPGTAAVPKPAPLARAIRQKAEIRHDLPCGNPACERFEGYLTGTSMADGTPAGPVRAVCPDCGYIYMVDARRPGGVCVVETGPLWDRTLAGVMDGCGHGLRATGRALGVSPTMVMRHARRLGLWRDEWTDRPKVQLRQGTVSARLLERHRAGWVDYRAGGGCGPAKEMPRGAFNAYRFLLRKDREWLRSNHPLTGNSRSGKGIDSE